MKKIVIVFLLFLNCSCFAASVNQTVFSMPIVASVLNTGCAQAIPSSSAGFCGSFKSVAICHCVEKLPPKVCQDMNTIYKRMIDMFGSVQRACEYQKDTSTQNCLDDWSCYRSGGRNSAGALCNATGNACT